MAIIGLSNATVRVNNVIVAAKANSVSVNDGKGTKSVKGISAGGEFSDVVVFEDVESRVGKIKFSLYTTAYNIELLRSWQSIDLAVGNTISVTDDDYHAVLSNGVVINDPDKMIGLDQSFEVEFHGRPII